MLSKPAGPKVSQTLLKLVPFILGVIVFTVAGILFFLVLSNSFKQTPAPNPTASAPTSTHSTQAIIKVGLPVRLVIPGINVDAHIGYAGTAPDGTMEITKSQDDVAWYEPGTRPGNVGSAVIAGHYGSLNGKYSVFSYLSKLNKGDTLSIKDHNGKLINFIVRESRTYDPAANATDIFNSTDGKSHLNLITCEGSWNQAKESYSYRRVVFTDKVVE